MVCESKDHRKRPSICFLYNNMEKVQAELALLSVEKARVTSDVNFCGQWLRILTVFVRIAME